MSVKPKQEAVKSLGTLDPLNIKPSQGRTAHPKKDLVFVHKFYYEKGPRSIQSVEATYYLGINHSKDSSKCWFQASPVGEKGKASSEHFVKRSAEKYAVDFEGQFSPTERGAYL